MATFELDRAAATPATSSAMTPCTPRKNCLRTHSGSSFCVPKVSTCSRGHRQELA